MPTTMPTTASVPRDTDCTPVHPEAEGADLIRLELRYNLHHEVAARVQDGDDLPVGLSDADEARLTLLLRDRDLVVYRAPDGSSCSVLRPELAAEYVALDEAAAALRGAA